ncbi:YY1-associated factor 2-like [Anneissia japonica]|uniref:YY1-associated factor 2-like n=1 Tax=Anneissia japonica TaxID=1529436 RepID=UPI0014259F49|nr:YY1-associated factor 2-like [Anneissia japonica]
MDSKRSSGRIKRSLRTLDEGSWDCSVCTYKNNPEAFKCEMCDVRKGTSTRKPRLNPQLVAQQQAQQALAQPPPTIKQTTRKENRRSTETKRNRPRLKNVDRTSAITTEVTVNDIPVVITEYKEKVHSRSLNAESSSSQASLDNTNNHV